MWARNGPGQTGVIAGWVTTYGYSLVLILKKLGTHVNTVVVVGLYRASRVFSGFPPSAKINLSLIHLSLTGPPLITGFLHWRGLHCININIMLLLLLHNNVYLRGIAEPNLSGATCNNRWRSSRLPILVGPKKTSLKTLRLKLDTEHVNLILL